MASVRLGLRFYGDTQVHRELVRFANRPGDMRPAWQEMANRFRRLEIKQFRSEGAHGGAAWAPLSPQYGAWKARHYPGKKILEREGDLKRSLTVRPFGIEVLEHDFMLVGSDVEHGQWHQRGVPGRLKMRKPIEFPERERVYWVRIMHRYIATGVASGGRARRR